MKWLALTFVTGSMLLGSCSSSLENIMDDRHQARLDAANANRPLIHGADDGLGSGIAETAPNGLTLAEHAPAAKPKNQ